MFECDPHTPVLVGVAAVGQKQPDYLQALEPLALMAQALHDAAADAGTPALLARADEILVPKGIWSYSDPGRLLAEAVGADRATTVLAEIGVLQQSLLSRACHRIAAGEAQVVLVAGGEAKYRALCASKAGAEAAETVQVAAEPDITLRPDDELWSPVESAAGLGMPVGYYAIMDSALRYKQGLTPEQHRDQMARTDGPFRLDILLEWRVQLVGASHVVVLISAALEPAVADDGEAVVQQVEHGDQQESDPEVLDEVGAGHLRLHAVRIGYINASSQQDGLGNLGQG